MKRALTSLFVFVFSVPVFGAAQQTLGTPSPILVSSNVRDCTLFPGEDAGEKIRKAAMDLPSSGGIIVCIPPGIQTIKNNPFLGLRVPLQLVLGPASTFYVTGSSWTITDKLVILGQLTTINYSGTGTLFATISDTDTPGDVKLEGLLINIAPPATGWLRVGEIAEDYSETNFRSRWRIRDVYVTGPGCLSGGCTLPRGTVGMSVTQYIDWTVDNLTVLGFERAALFDRGGNTHFSRVRFQSYTFGPKWTSRGGSGKPAGGSSMDVCTSCEFLGPTATGTTPGVDFGYTVDIDAPGLTFVGALYEAQATSGKSQGLIHITERGGRFRDVNGTLSWNRDFPGTLLNTIVLDDNYFEPAFFGTVLTVPGFPPVRFGNPATFDIGSKAQFVGCSARLNELVNDQALNKSVILGEINNVTFKTNSEIHDQEGMFRVVPRAGYAQPPAPIGRGFQIQYQDRADQALLSSFDSDRRIFKPVVVEASTWSFAPNTDVRVNKRILETPRSFNNGDTTPSVAFSNIFRVENTAVTRITNFVDGIVGQQIRLLFTNDNTTLVNSRNLRLMGATDFRGTVDAVITLFSDDGVVWREASRSIN